ncbi:hypothetical protein HMPREF0083_03419 [Aneurinibacillus aneurinilyticus ATCC 12856]|uniref:Uncharacterized protein n=1 Tax=Aneurinibacillus aneurinilyticus ATCC 12856 TaxID=649747 RepID=U1Y8J9_ANEAE|nr:hypothetical protein HMPREF0083_03419 [Aneurinibacillus aneurinilyticus ATCC 12856]
MEIRFFLIAQTKQVSSIRKTNEYSFTNYVITKNTEYFKPKRGAYINIKTGAVFTLGENFY